MNSDDQQAWEDARREAQKRREADPTERSNLIVTGIFIGLGLVALWVLFHMQS